MSDLHLEIGQQYADFVIPAGAPYLVLAGDTGRLKDYQPYLEFIVRQCAHFTKVFLVPGNHEFFGISHAEGLRLAICLEQEPGCGGKLHVMSRNRVDIGSSLGLTILGCTLQSHIPPDAKIMVQMKVNDFKRIEGWTVDDHNSEHQRDLKWLQREIQVIRSQECQYKRSIVVITLRPQFKVHPGRATLSNLGAVRFRLTSLRTKRLPTLNCGCLDTRTSVATSIKETCG